MNEDYTKRELDSHFTEIKDSLYRIEQQTIKTNGRVNKLESWRSLLVGAWFVAYCMVIPLSIYIYLDNMNYLKEIIQQNSGAIVNINSTLNSLNIN